MVGVRIFLSIFLLFFLGACGDENKGLVNKGTLNKISIMPHPIINLGTSVIKVAKGGTQPFIAMAYYENGTVENITKQVFWYSSNELGATISQEGLLRGSEAGRTTITAIKDGITSNSVSVEITDAVINTIQITPVTNSIAKGQSQQLAATATYSDSTTGDITNSVAWVVEDVNLATISQEGLLRGSEAGRTTITAIKDGITSNSVSVEITDAVINTIQITPVTNSIAKGQSQQLVATATYSDSTTGDITNSVAWVVEDVNLATISQEGLLTGSEVGRTTITASKDSITSNSVSVDINKWVVVNSVGKFSVPDFVFRNWASANNYCAMELETGWRLPTKSELEALYTLYPGNKINTMLGWKTNIVYWTSTFATSKGHYNVDLRNGVVIGHGRDIYYSYVTCIQL
ncbi:Ig-like domain-containing protein [Aeromonas veronii]